MGVCDAGPGEVDHPEQCGVKIGIIKGGVVKDRAPDAADGKLAALKL